MQTLFDRMRIFFEMWTMFGRPLPSAFPHRQLTVTRNDYSIEAYVQLT